MNATDDLHRLIESLSPSEKRYFKLFTVRQGLKDEKNYILLFDLIDKEDEYDEEKIKKKLKKTTPVKVLPQLKNYLLNLIMRSMRIYRSETNVSNTIFELLQDEQFYKDRGLYDLHIKALKKAKDIAIAYDLTYLLFPILLRLKGAEINYSGKNHFEIIEPMHKEEDILLENLITETKIGQLQTNLFCQYVEDPLLNDAEKINVYNNLKDSTLLQNFENLKTFKSKWHFLRAHCMICRFNNDNTTALPYYRKIIELFDTNPHQRNADMNEYKVALNNYLAACHRAGYYDDFLQTLNKVQDIPTETYNEEIGTFHLVSNNKILYALNTSDLTIKNQLLKDIEAGLLIYKKSIKGKSLVAIYYNICIMCFVSGDFYKALDYSNTVLNLQAEARKDLQSGAKLLQLILHYELDNLQLLDSLIRNTTRNLQKENKYYAFEKLLTSNLKKLLKSLPDDRKKIFTDFKNDLLLLKVADEKFKFVIMDEVILWTSSKINQSSMSSELKTELQIQSV
ncbi:MAG: hypothetical protein H7Y00_02110 [Fimbriimonadaceae bacterium]|nr:hypothetical protein [Chitinophagales bacterium]